MPLLPGQPTAAADSSAAASLRGQGPGSLRSSYSCPPSRSNSTTTKASAAQRLPPGGAMVKMSDPPTPLQLTNGGPAADPERASRTSSHDMDGEPSWGSIQAYQQGAAAAAAGGGQYMHGMYANGGGQHQDELDRRKFTRNLLSANNKKESLERYKAIMSLIEACRRRLELQLGPAAAAAVLAEAAWAQEPLVSLLQSVLDVGEALASFGNCHFPEHSNEARAILAGDYRALLKQYLSSFGFVFAQPTKQQLTHDMQVGAALALGGRGLV